MDEMTYLEELCAVVPPPDEQTLTAARARVLGAAQPASPGRPRRRLARPPLLSWRRLALTGAVVVLAAAAVAVGVFPHTPPGDGTRVQLDAVMVLDRAAKAALAGPSPGDSQFLYTDIRAVNPSHGKAWSYRQQTWMSVDGQQVGALRNTTCYPGLPARDNLPTCLAKVPAEAGGPLNPTFAWVRSLPTSPAALLQYLEQHNNCTGVNGIGVHSPPTSNAYSEIYAILHLLYVLPPRTGAALFRAAAMIPGVTVLPHVTDAAGGQGIGVTMAGTPGPGGPLMSFELIFDPHSYRFIGVQNVSLANGPGQIAGHVNHAETLISTRVVNTAPTHYTRDRSGPLVEGGTPTCIHWVPGAGSSPTGT
jgi:hypothetical protein